MITINNYLEKSKDISFDELSEALKKGHAFTAENIDLYGEDADIDKAIDLHLKNVNAFILQNQKKINKKLFKIGDKVKVKKYGWIMVVDNVDNSKNNQETIYNLENFKNSKSAGNPGGYDADELILVEKKSVSKSIKKGLKQKSKAAVKKLLKAKSKAAVKKLLNKKRIVDIGYGNKGTEYTVAWDRNKKENGDYKTIAHINDLTGELEIFDKELPIEAIKELKEYAKTFSKKQSKEKLACPPLDADGKPRVDEEGLQLLQKCIQSQPSTKKLNTKDGKYTAAREKLHEKIVDEFKDNKPCIVQQKPIAILTGGPPGSGKSHFLKKFAPWITSGKLYHIDADEVRSKLPEYKGWNADNTHLETKDIVNELLDSIGQPCEHDLIYDGTMNKAGNYLPLIEKLHKMGYEVFVIYLQVPKELSIKRAMERYQRTGRYVPLEVIEDVYAKGLDAFEEVIKKADGYIRVNGEDGKIVERGGKQIPKEREYPIPCCDDCENGIPCEGEGHKTKSDKPKHEPPAEPNKTDIEYDAQGNVIIKPSGPKRFTTEEKKQAVEAIRAKVDMLTQDPRKLSISEVLTIAQEINQHHRSLWSQTYDATHDSRKRLSPNPENLLRWMKNPGKFDLIGVDNFRADNPTADLKIKQEIFWHKLGFKIKSKA